MILLGLSYLCSYRGKGDFSSCRPETQVQDRRNEVPVIVNVKFRLQRSTEPNPHVRGTPQLDLPRSRLLLPREDSLPLSPWSDTPPTVDLASPNPYTSYSRT